MPLGITNAVTHLCAFLALGCSYKSGKTFNAIVVTAECFASTAIRLNVENLPRHANDVVSRHITIPVFPAIQLSVALMLPALTALPTTIRPWRWPLKYSDGDDAALRTPMFSG